jgi:hypothetical protein
LFIAMNRIAKLVGLGGARASGEGLSCSLFAEGSRQGHLPLACLLDGGVIVEPSIGFLRGTLAVVVLFQSGIAVVGGDR